MYAFHVTKSKIAKMNETPKAVVFDVIGTLFETEDALREAFATLEVDPSKINVSRIRIRYCRV